MRPTRPCRTSYSPPRQMCLAKTLTTYSLLLSTPNQTTICKETLQLCPSRRWNLYQIQILNGNVFTTVVQEINRYVYSHLLFSFMQLVGDLVFKKYPDIRYQDTCQVIRTLFHKTVLISILNSTVLSMVALGNEEQVGCKHT